MTRKDFEDEINNELQKILKQLRIRLIVCKHQRELPVGRSWRRTVAAIDPYQLPFKLYVWEPALYLDRTERVRMWRHEIAHLFAGHGHRSRRWRYWLNVVRGSQGVSAAALRRAKQRWTSGRNQNHLC